MPEEPCPDDLRSGRSDGLDLQTFAARPGVLPERPDRGRMFAGPQRQFDSFLSHDSPPYAEKHLCFRRTRV